MQNFKYGFEITEEEMRTIKEWQQTHEQQYNDEDSLFANVIGEEYHYIFTPTTLGVIGKVRCQCGAEFEFRSII